jgi:hypothetical protein
VIVKIYSFRALVHQRRVSTNQAYRTSRKIGTHPPIKNHRVLLGYLKDKIGIGLPVPCFLGRLEGVGRVGRKTFIDKNFKGVQQAHYSILQHLTIMTHLVNEHLSMIRASTST